MSLFDNQIISSPIDRLTYFGGSLPDQPLQIGLPETILFPASGYEDVFLTIEFTSFAALYAQAVQTRALNQVPGVYAYLSQVSPSNPNALQPLWIVEAFQIQPSVAASQSQYPTLLSDLYAQQATAKNFELGIFIPNSFIQTLNQLNTYVLQLVVTPNTFNLGVQFL